MMRSLFSGVAGLRTHQTRMDVIGNNIANVNTVAYKNQSATFQELMYQNTQNASAANNQTGRGGINMKQIGLGSSVGAINTNIALSGSSQSTGNALDIQIAGDAFFVVSDGSERFFTRAGAFYIDGAGNLAMTSNGYIVQGWQANEQGTGVLIDNVSPLQVMSADKMTAEPEQTTRAYINGVIDANDNQLSSAAGRLVNVSIYDSLGYSYIVQYSIKPVITQEPVPATQDGKPKFDGTGPLYVGEDGKEYKSEGDAGKATPPTKLKKTDVVVPNKYTIKPAKLIDSKGHTIWGDPDKYPPNAEDYEKVPEYITRTPVKGDPAKPDGDPLKEDHFTYTWKTGLANVGLEANATADPPIQADTIEFDSITGLLTRPSKDADSGEAPIGLQITGIDAFQNLAMDSTCDLSIDLSAVKEWDNKGSSTTEGHAGTMGGEYAGRRMGTMSGIAVQQDGIIIASYDNGTQRILGQIAVTSFANPQGLEKVGDNLYKPTSNSGYFDGIGKDITSDGSGSLKTGVLEMSNVDLSQEFTEMITTQRGFQANSRIITVSDTMLEELINLKR